MIRGVRGRVVAVGGLGDALYRRAAVHRGLVRRRARARRYGPREKRAWCLGCSWTSTTSGEIERGSGESAVMRERRVSRIGGVKWEYHKIKHYLYLFTIYSEYHTNIS